MNKISSESIVIPKASNACYHCGESCDGAPILHDDKDFCCEGCKMVYSILSENNLDNYYRLNEQAGISQKNRTQPEKYAFLDDPSAIAQLIDFSDGDQCRVHFSLPQIHCSSCLWLLEHLHLLNEAVAQARVNFLKREVHITFQESALSLRGLVELLARIGYPPQINLQDLDGEEKVKVDRSLYYKLGLASFVFGNIMLLSFPEYLGLNALNHPLFTTYFGYINFVLILPVLLYSGKDYFISAYQGLRQRHLNIDVPVSLGILALFFRSSYEIFTHTDAGYLDSLAGLIFFLLIGKWFQQITYNKISFDKDYKSYFPIACNLKTDAGEEQVTLDKLKKGDLVLLRHGELIPADSILMKGEANIDYSFVTGESEPVPKSVGDHLYAGGRQMDGLIEVSVVKKVANSYLMQLWNESTFSKPKSAGTTSQIADRVARIFTITILIIAFATLFYWLPKDVGLAINAFSAVLIVACPCAVALSIPFTFGNVVRVLMRQGIYLKNIQVIEGLARINHIVFDKTGTLTQSKTHQIKYHGNPLKEAEKIAIRSVAGQSIHPRSRQLVALFKSLPSARVQHFQEFKGQGISGTVNGLNIRLGAKQFVKESAISEDAQQSGVHVEIDNEYKGLFAQQSQYRIGLKSLLDRFKSWAKLSLLSGDNSSEQAAMAELFGSSEQLHFSQKPTEKLSYIQALQTEGQSVAMVGDGLNDAGALSQSDVGIAITEDSSYFSPSCDIIMEAKQFNKLATLFDYARSSITLVYVAYGIALLYNIIGLSYAVQGALSPVIAAILMPISSITILVFGVFSSSYMAWKKGL